ncbi:formate dehydrogenase accessory sulfurtransferase FdhD [Natranaerobius trueperi]|uniref:Sulfur carrier protein FdhD n=1 Tax=Natranaerobius trueperi TaxID=759412 RepID=A0A226C1H5_9FIRM|nr:formate dehydrogenase accessory sulfurtransferase FdhD [Natranaerobius trueperi]OWZ84882.1 formate dehydrogenase family accessory protein FdhD [Natranaerobius trueperi]
MSLPVSEEKPIELYVNDRKFATFMCTPEYLKELALGHLFTKGIISDMFDINIMNACDELNTITVTLNKDIPEDQFDVSNVITSGCGSGGQIQEDIENNSIDSNLSVYDSLFRNFFVDMYNRSIKYLKTGGIHSAAIADSKELLLVREDVGRHNAVDKVIGASLIKRYDPSSCIVITTGRLSSDMVLKALGAGFPIVATRSIPTNLALEIAQKTNITLIGRGHRASDKIIYTGHERVK